MSGPGKPDWCTGCASAAEELQVNLPEGWQPGDAIPDGLTVHHTERDPRRFAFVGHKVRQQRHYFAEGEGWA